MARRPAWGFRAVGLGLVCLAGCAAKAMTPVASVEQPVNHLAHSASAYLRSAAHQPVGWFEWGEEAFHAAQALDRPILLDVGAVWCHWCHVIDRESYENPAIAALINERFVPIKVDVDARPDIDRRYQELVSALTGQGGWPLTVFLTPTGQVIYGGTYFPPEDRHGMPGMRGILLKVAELYQTQKSHLVDQAARLHQEFDKHRAESLKSGELTPALVERLAAILTQQFDAEHGGFGDAPKFPSASALELALQLSVRRHDAALRRLVTTALDGMAAGGIHDQLSGAFHRYSTDRFWRVPHFEILLTVNAELLALYTHAYQVTHAPRYREVAEGVIAYMTTTLSDQARGGFYGSQDADYSPEDDGDYYTWTVAEARAALTADEFEVLRRAYDIEPQGEMRENPAKNVLYVAATPTQTAEALKRPLSDVQSLLASGRTKLLRARQQRKAPFVDPTFYLHWNSLMISAYLEAAVVFDRPDVQFFALKTLERLWTGGWREGAGLSHTVVDDLPGVPGLLEDYVQIAAASLDAYQATQDRKYLARARQLMDEAIRRFWDETGGGFFDNEARPEALGALQERRKPIQDAPTASGNGIAAGVLQRLAALTEEPRYQTLAERTLKAFAGNISEYGLFAATLAQQVDLVLRPPAHLVIVGPAGAATRALMTAALQAYSPGKTIQMKPQDGPPSAQLCVGTTCRPPITDPARLAAALMEPASS